MRILPLLPIALASCLSAVSAPGCHNFTVADENAAMQLDAQACSELVPLIPVVGSLLEPLACAGEEALLQAALDAAVTSLPDGGAAAAVITPAGLHRVAVFAGPVNARRRVGFVPGHLAAAVQAHLDGASSL